MINVSSNCKLYSKGVCANCKHFDYCDRACKCNGHCEACDIVTCENNPKYDEVSNIEIRFYEKQLYRKETVRADACMTKLMKAVAYAEANDLKIVVIFSDGLVLQRDYRKIHNDEQN